MFLKFFWVPALDSSTAEAEVNAFLGSHRVAHVDRQLAMVEQTVGWAVCVQWVPAAAEADDPGAGRKGSTDYKAVLDEPTFRIFAALRAWRKEVAAVEGVPIYTVATNEQLASIARQRIRTKAALLAVEGFGSGRKERYADGVLGVCAREMESPAPPAP